MQAQVLSSADRLQAQVPSSAVSMPASSRALPAAIFTILLALGGYLRWSYPELTLFGLDQQTAVYMGKVVRLGWQFPLVGIQNSMGAAAGPGEYYLMALPQFLSDAPEVSAAYVGLLGLAAGAMFSLVIWRQFNAFTGLATLALFSAGPWSVYFTRLIWTPDTIPLFTAGSYALLLAGLGHRKRWTLPLGLMLLGAATQIHHSALALLPGAALCVLLFIRRVRLRELAAGLILALLTLAPWLWNDTQTNFVDLQRMLVAGGVPATYDVKALQLLQTLVSGDGYPEAVGLAVPSGMLPPKPPLLPDLLAAALWLGAVLALWRVGRDLVRRQVSPGTVALALALAFSVVPAAFNLRHSFSLFMRYFVCTFPVSFLLPALALAELPRLVGLLRIASGRQVGQAVATLFVALAALAGAWQVEAVNHTLASEGAVPVAGRDDMWSGPFIRDSRLAMERLEKVVSPDFETVVTGAVQRGPLEYLAANRYRLRYVDQPTMLVLPHQRSRLVFLPDTAWAADLALTLGASETKDVALLWPPSDAQTRVVDVDPTRTTISQRFTAVTKSQVLPDGLELLAYSVENDSGQEFSLLTVWRVANADWAHRYWLYNSFTHAFAVEGKQVDVWGEVELSTSSNWKQDDLIVLPTRVIAKSPLARGAYNLQLGVYVRFPARAPLQVDPGAVETVSFGPVRLGKPAEASVSSRVVATLEPGVMLAEARATLNQSENRVEVELVWCSQVQPSRNYTVFAHLYDAAGKLVAQADGWPSGGNYPTSLWAAGEDVRDQRVLPLQTPLAPGVYTVKVGMYDAQTMLRLKPSQDSGDSTVIVGQIQVPAK